MCYEQKMLREYGSIPALWSMVENVFFLESTISHTKQNGHVTNELTCSLGLGRGWSTVLNLNWNLSLWSVLRWSLNHIHWLLTSHVLNRLLTSDILNRLLTSDILNRLLTTNVLYRLLTSSVLYLLLTTNVLYRLLTTNVLYLLLTWLLDVYDLLLDFY